jgi:hypothetical protein
MAIDGEYRGVTRVALCLSGVPYDQLREAIHAD